MADLSGQSLLELATELVAISSPSGEEMAIATFVEEQLEMLPGLEVLRVGDNVVARSDAPDNGSEPLLLAGHLDTVPPFANSDGAKLEGEVLRGLGAVDMKGGVAVLLALAANAASRRRPTTFVFYAREEVARARSGLLELAAAHPDLLAASVAVIAEATGGSVEAGCQGVLRARVRLRGRRAHTARAWTGINAIHRLAGLLGRVADFDERRPVIDGCEYRESLQAVAVEGGVATNVVPDEATLVLSLRFAPDHDLAGAEAALRAALDGSLGAGDELLIEESSPPAPPALGHPDLARLVAASGRPPRAKLGWTDVAFFAERGIPAANFGPGDPLLAHTPDEHVSAAELEAAAAALLSLFEG